MEKQRLKHTIRLWMTMGPAKRTKYLKEHHVFADMGENCSIMDRRVPLYANLIKLGNNVHLASKVDFITHDISHVMINNIDKKLTGGGTAHEKIGCIELGDNVFVGSHTTILYDVKIGNNVIVGAGSLVNKDIPDNSVVAGVPARVVGNFEEFMKKKLSVKAPDNMRVVNQIVPNEYENYLWTEFREKHK